MQAFHDVVQAGYARYIGMSSCWAWQFQLMQRESHRKFDDLISLLIRQNTLFRTD